VSVLVERDIQLYYSSWFRYMGTRGAKWERVTTVGRVQTALVQTLQPKGCSLINLVPSPRHLLWDIDNESSHACLCYCVFAYSFSFLVFFRSFFCLGSIPGKGGTIKLLRPALHLKWEVVEKTSQRPWLILEKSAFQLDSFWM
jgi:hypothetical protein